MNFIIYLVAFELFLAALIAALIVFSPTCRGRLVFNLRYIADRLSEPEPDPPVELACDNCAAEPESIYESDLMFQSGYCESCNQSIFEEEEYYE